MTQDLNVDIEQLEDIASRISSFAKKYPSDKVKANLAELKMLITLAKEALDASTPHPNWTVLYNITTLEGAWVGTGREFFTSEALAHRRFEEIRLHPRYTASIRLYNHKADHDQRGAVHRSL